jgi:hypothetical protein
MPSPRGAARALTTTLRKHRRSTRAIAAGILVYVLVIAMTGGIDVRLGPIRFRSHETDWLLRLAALVALTDLLVSERAMAGIGRFLRHVRDGARRAQPAVLGVAAGLSAAALLLWGVARLVAGMPEETPGGDMALLELYTRHAARTELLVGPYSRFQWNHPGPAMFYLFRPLYELSGDRFESLRASALLLNAGCLAATLAIVRRLGGPTLLFAASIGLGLHLLRVNDMLASPWNPHLLLLPLALLLASCAAVLDRRPQFAVVAVATASFVVQTHLSVTPTVALLLAATSAAVLARLVVDSDRLLYRRWLNLALWIGLAFWLLPLAQELASSGGNLTAIYESFLEEPQPGPITREGYAAFFHTLSSFLMPGFSTAWGGLVVRGVTWVGFIVAVATLVALPWAAKQFSRQGNRFGAALATLLVVASLAALWSVLRIQGELFDQLVFWITVIGVLNTACVAAAIADWPRAGVPGDGIASHGIVRHVATGAAIGVVLLITIVGALQLYDGDRARGDEPTVRRIRGGAAAVSSYLDREKITRPLVYIAQPTWGDVAGIALILQKSERDVAIEPGWVFMFGQSFAPNGTEDGELVFADAVRRQLLLQEGRHTIVAEWPELTILAARVSPPPADQPARP